MEIKFSITLSDGEQLDRTCRYIDDYHLEVGSNLYHICEFAERMEQNGNTVIPLRSSLPEQCYVFVQTENCVGIVKKGESGFYRTDIQGGKPSETNALVNEMNEQARLVERSGRGNEGRFNVWLGYPCRRSEKL
ncbi:MAG: hypothetical protein ACLUML_02320 [Acutalibacteraceae bacterium]